MGAQHPVDAIAMIQSWLCISFSTTELSSVSLSGTKTGPRPIPKIAPSGMARDPSPIAKALYSSGNHTVEIFDMQVYKKGC